MSGDRLVLSGITAAIAGRPVVRDLSTSLRGGQLVALCGPNGAGKTTLLRVIAGLHPATGTLTWAGDAVAGLSHIRRARTFGYLPQGHQTHWPLPVREIVALGRFARGATDPRRLGAKDAAAVDQAMAEAGITALADRPATALSGGERARVALARVLALGAPVILADEPAASLDPRHQRDVMALLRKIAEAGALVIAVTHDLAQARAYAHRCLVVDQGRLVADGAPDIALGPDVLANTFRLAPGEVPGLSP